MHFLALISALVALPSIACAGISTPASVSEVVELSASSSVLEIATVEDRRSAPTIDDEATEFDHQHALFNTLLKKHVKAGWIDYQGVIADKKKLGRYLRQLRAVTPAELKSWTREQRYAFWINVYNAHVIKVVIDNYPLRSIKDIGGAVFNKVWDKQFIDLPALHPDGSNEKLSLNHVEHGILRPRFKDARVHAAVNCASYSCPVILDEAFTADKIEEQLERQMTLFIRDGLRNRIDPASGELKISEIFNWFEDDFKRDYGSVREYLIHFAPENQAEFIKKADVRHLEYDWSLNDIEANRQ